jgi:hypothetical protein
MTTKTRPAPQLGDPIGEWPPLAHLVRKDQLPAKEGDIALCGAKLMGINLDTANKVCEKCVRIARQEMQR